MYDLIASEYGWPLDKIMDLTFFQQHMLLTRIVERRQREAGVEAKTEIEVIDAKGLASFMG